MSELFTVERDSPQTGERIQRTFTTQAKADEFHDAAAVAGQNPTFVLTPHNVKEMYARVRK